MKRNTILVLIFILILGGSLLAGEKTTAKVKVPAANVRSKPDASAPIVAKVTVGTVLEVTGKAGAWYEVNVNDQSGKEVTGYINSTLVEVSGEEEEETQVKPRAARREVPEARAEKEYAGGGFKLMGGLSLCNGTFSETLPTGFTKTSKMGFTGGLGYESGGMIAFEADLFYGPGGAVINYTDPTDPTNTGKITISATAITLPIMLKVRFLRGATPYILAGGEVGYTLTNKLIVKASDGTTNEEDAIDDYVRLVYGVVFGGGFELQAGGMNFLLEARYRLGLSNQIKDPDPGDYIKATALTFLLGVKF
jgi:uncharacterized protein YgiM (DUF1202 family)